MALTLSQGLVVPVPGRRTQRSCLRVRQPLRSEGAPTTGHWGRCGRQSPSLKASAVGMVASGWCSPWLLFLKRADSLLIIIIKFGDRCNPLDRGEKDCCAELTAYA